MSHYSMTLVRHLEMLSVAHALCISDDYRWVIVKGFRLPPGFSREFIDVLVEIPSDYPCSPPGIGNSHVYVPPDLRYWGNRLRDIHKNVTPGWGYWAWLCYEQIDWDPHQDDLVKFMEMIRGDLTNPPTK